MSQKWLIKTKVTVFLHLFGCGFFRYIFQANQPQGHPMPPPPPPLGFERPPRTYRLLAKIRLSLRKWNSRLGRLFFFFLYSSCLTQLAKTFPGEGGHHIQCPSLGRTICSFSCNFFFFFFAGIISNIAPWVTGPGWALYRSVSMRSIRRRRMMTSWAKMWFATLNVGWSLRF